MRVAVAVIYDALGRILLTQRPDHADHGGQWEFPGGKLQTGEHPVEALKREVKEEVGLDVLDMEFITDIEHSYTSKQVVLHVYRVTGFQGTARCLESQIDLRWVSPEKLTQFDFPEANHKIIRQLVPSSYG
jgi:8-oxo-dGTP diphosphatase